MTDAAFAAAPAAPAPVAIPIDTGAAHIPNPSEGGNIPQADQTTQGQPPKGEDRKSLDDVIKNAHEKATKQAETKDKIEAPKPQAEGKTKADDAAKQEATRSQPVKGPDGKFQSTKPQEAAQAPQPAQAQGPHAEAPSRFSQDAKAAWATAPEPVKAEVHRMQREFEQGFTKYKADAEAYNSVRDFDDYAKQHGATLRQVLANYATLERQLVQGDAATKDAALQKVFQRADVNPREWAARILGMTPDQRDAESHQTISALRSEIAALKQAVTGVTTHVQEQQKSAITQSVDSFAKANPRFEELSAGHLEHSIQNILRSNLIPQNLPAQDRLQKAYDMADRLNPATAPRQPSSGSPPAPSNDAGNKSIAGSPANGSDPSLPAPKKGQRVSIDDALKRAQQRLAS